MARKVAAAAMNTETPRRSTRISAQTQSDPPQAGTSTKRSADEEISDGKAGASQKKAKATEGDKSLPSEVEGKIGSIDIGDPLPSITLKNEKGEDVDVANLAAEKGVILFLVPKADTPGCTNQACGFRDSYPDYASLNFDVYCLSADSPSAQANWQTKKSLPYPLLSDPNRVLIAALGAADGGKTKRSHFIFEKGGKLVNKKLPVKPLDSPKLALEFIKSFNET